MHQDTIVRYSSSKGIARIAERLPSDFTAQVLENIMQLFSVHLVAGESFYEMPAIAEATWHGACLACAELARRGLVANNQLSALVTWLTKVMLLSLLIGAQLSVIRRCTSISAKALIPLGQA